jgi:hypothetical protein
VDDPAAVAGQLPRVAGYLAGLAVLGARLRARGTGWFGALGLWRPVAGDALAVALGVFAVAGLRALTYAYLAAIGAGAHVQTGLEGFRVVNWAGVIVAVFVAAALAPVAEEVFFRGVAFKALEARTTPLRAAFGSGALFAFARLDVALFPFFVLYGTMLALLYRRTNNLWVPILVRGIFDGATTAALVWLDISVR